MKTFSKVILFVLIAFSTQISSAQDLSFDLGGDLYSRYIWRGAQLGGTSPSIQPYASLTYKNLEFGFWSAYSVSALNTGQEFDIYLSYSFLDEMFSVTFTDYFFPDVTTNYNYFNYAANTTGHVMEGIVSFNGTENFPLSLMFAVNFFGDDAARLDNDPNSADFNQKIGIQYSNYLELGYTATVGDVELTPFVGATLSSPLEADANTGFVGESGFYASKPGVVNAGFSLSKEIKITDNFNLPISASVITNPDAKKVYFALGISF